MATADSPLRRTLQRTRDFLERCVRIDTRSLAVFRIVAALLILADLALRSRNFTYFYTDEGVVPRSLVYEASSDPGWSIYHLTTDPTLIAGLFVLQALFAIQLLVGYKTRLATIISFLFVVSLDHHNPFVLSYADTLFRLLLFWAIFLPLGERWSIDAVHAGREPRVYVASLASAFILGQMVYMYVTNGLIKSQSDVWGTADAAPLVLGLDEMTYLLGDTIREFQTLLGFGGVLWYYMLVFAWLLIVLRGRLRMAMVGLFVGGHLSFALTVRIGAFAYVALAGLVLFLQPQFWRDAAAILERLGLETERFAARTASLERLAARVPNPRIGGERTDQLRDHAYTASIGLIVATILFVAVVMGGNIGLVVAESVTDADESERALEYQVEDVVIETLTETDGVTHVESTASKLGIDQPIGWGVFAGPDPRTTDRYHVFAAETVDGEQLDIYNDRPLTYERPGQELQTQHGTYRERFYMNSVRSGHSSDLVAEHLAEHLCEQWTDNNDGELEAISMYVVNEQVTRETITDPTDRDRTASYIYRHGCGDNSPRIIQEPGDDL
ncbi:HTTM domain-containing protein [Natronolimnobius sp. AArcel1]|uniref:HTTM domain-containing protein n=1 Tax=Natronolimnobius sp. AArcel1 TaxID=1679093 RepID=UPI0013ED16FA|nr:HTTM domain-containing protein [Natronolimnobius sp. AArcel1]NGM68657.1 HTTM domain-containing protein [Natronolimnobius sp. AArcel1]